MLYKVAQYKKIANGIEKGGSNLRACLHQVLSCLISHLCALKTTARNLFGSGHILLEPGHLP